VSFGIGVRHGIASFGVYVNVANDLADWQNIATMPGDCAPYMGSLLSENVAAGRIEIVRAPLMEQLSLALASTKTSIHAGHSLLPVKPIIAREHAA
jgi:lipoate-protein ligase B